MKSKPIVIIKTLLFACFAVFLVTGLFCVFLNSPIDRHGESVLFSVRRGSSVFAIADSLESTSFVRSKYFAYLYARIFNLSLKAGTFKISPSMTTAHLLRYLDEGKQEYIRVTVPEGLSLSKTARHMEDEGVVAARDFITAARDPVTLQKFHIVGKDAEGYLFPDTYFFPYENDASAVVSEMIRNFFNKVATLENTPTDPVELHKKIILASIVEREYRLDTEAPLIASVFTNRLKIGMGLQSCATIEYIITEIQQKTHPSRLTLEDLAIRNDYNTYLWAGLPPGPIANPGLVALSAAFTPARTDYLYFRLTDAEAGSHSFTRSLDEHVAAGRHLVLKKAAGD